MGNRGIIHDEQGNILRTHAHQNCKPPGAAV